MKDQLKSEAKEQYPFTDLEKRAVNYVATDDIAMFADGGTRMIYEHYYIKGSEIENSKLLEEITRLKAELEKERELRKELVDSLHALLKYSRRWLDEYTNEIIQSLIQKAKDL